MNLESWISQEDSSEELLPLCHTTKWKYFEKIINDNKLSTSFSKFPDSNPSDTKQNNIVYLFYGMPFYIYEIGEGNEINSEVTEDLPIGLIFKPDLATKTDSFYPFDTGALLSNRYKNILDIDIDKDLIVYQVNITDGNEMKKFVKRYYKFNENYCYGDFNNSTSSSHAKEENLMRLLRDGNKSKVDLRNRAIEVHSLKDINISKNLLAVILPRLRSIKYDYIKKDLGILCSSIDIEYYNDLNRFSSESIRGLLITATMDYYNKNHSKIFSYNRIAK